MEGRIENNLELMEKVVIGKKRGEEGRNFWKNGNWNPLDCPSGIKWSK